MFTNNEAVTRDIFAQGTRQIIKACDIVKRIPRDCVSGSGEGMDGIHEVVRISESELAFQEMSEVSFGFSKTSRDTTSTSTSSHIVLNSEDTKPQKSLKDFSSHGVKVSESQCRDNLVHAMCQEVVINSLSFPHLNHNSQSSSLNTFEPIFRKPMIPEVRVKQNPSKKSASICRKVVEELVKTLITSKRQERKRIQYNKVSIINIWTSKCEISSCEPPEECVSVDGLQFRSFSSSEHLDSFLIKHQARCHSVKIFESVTETPATEIRTRTLKKRGRPLGWRKDKVIVQTLEIRETESAAENLERTSLAPQPEDLCDDDTAPVCQIQETVEIAAPSLTTSSYISSSAPSAVTSVFTPVTSAAASETRDTSFSHEDSEVDCNIGVIQTSEPGPTFSSLPSSDIALPESPSKISEIAASNDLVPVVFTPGTSTSET